MPSYENSADCVTPDAEYAREHKYEVHRDKHGWYVVKPTEWRDSLGRNKRGVFLGSTRGRPHFYELEAAWSWAAALQRRHSRRK